MTYSPIQLGSQDWGTPLNDALTQLDTDAANAQAAADTAQTTAETAQSTASTAQTSADNAMAAVTGPNKQVALADADVDYWRRIDITSDGTTGSGPDRLQFWLGATRVFAINEYGEARCRQGNNNTVALRIFGWGYGGGSTGDTFQFVNGSNSVVYFRMAESEVECKIPLKVTGRKYIEIDGIRQYTAATDPDASAPNGSVWIDTTNKVIKVRTGGAWV